jgi:hypothetical protein
VFVSCGQSSPEERLAATQVEAALAHMQFCPFVAAGAHTSKGLTENIYDHLATAEYFLFIDFRREAIGTDKAGHHRGSLFTHQELGIASFLTRDLLPFVQEDVRREGIMAFIQGNGISFRLPSELPDLVRKHVAQEKWDPTYRRELRIDSSPPDWDIAYIPIDIFRVIKAGEYAYYHLKLRNLHSQTMATNCIIQIVGCRGPSYASKLPADVVELKFKHITLPFVLLPPGSTRQFDAIVVRKNERGFGVFAIPGIIHPTYIDSEGIYAQYAITEPGDYVFDLQISSTEFGTGVQQVKVHIGESWDETRVEVKPKSPPRKSSGARNETSQSEES